MLPRTFTALADISHPGGQRKPGDKEIAGAKPEALEAAVQLVGDLAARNNDRLEQLSVIAHKLRVVFPSV